MDNTYKLVQSWHKEGEEHIFTDMECNPRNNLVGYLEREYSKILKTLGQNGKCTSSCAVEAMIDFISSLHNL